MADLPCRYDDVIRRIAVNAKDIWSDSRVFVCLFGSLFGKTLFFIVVVLNDR